MRKQSLLEPLAVSPQPVIRLEYQAMLHQVLAVTVRAGLFSYLAVPHTLAELCREKKWRPYFAELVLKILVLAGFAAVHEDVYEASPAAKLYLRAESELCLAECLQLDFAPGGFAQNVASLLDAEAAMPLRPLMHWDPSRLRRLGAYAITGNLRETIAAIGLQGHERVLDLGGGHALYSIALLEKYPELSITVQDLPEVIPLARQNAREYGAEDQLDFLGADFIEEALGTGYDVVLCFNILSGQERTVIILPKVMQALKPGGRVILKTRFEDCEERLEDMLDKLRWFSFGRKSVDSSSYWLETLGNMGFQHNRVLARLGSSGLLEGRKI